MRTATRRGVLAAVTALVLLALGLGVGVVVGDALGIRTEASEQMESAAPVVPTIAAAVPPPVLDAVTAPETLRIDTAVVDLRAAIEEASERAGEASLSVVIRDGIDGDDDTYRLAGTPTALRIEAATETGAVRGVYDLAAGVRAGRSIAEHLGEEVTSRLPLRMVDLGAVAVDPDTAQWKAGTDYSHASKAFADVLLPDAPYIDQAALEAAYAEFDDYLQRVVADGYNAVAFPGFVEFVTFDDAPGGPVYAEGDHHRALAMRDAFGPFWDRAQDLGMKVFLRTDMLTLTTPLENSLTDRFGSLDTANPQLWDVYAAGLDELYAAEPALDGVLIRIGEAGRVYDVDGWDVYSALAVTTVDSVRAMLDTLTAQAEASDRNVIFRTWSVGVGAVGDMHTDDASYEEVLSGIDSPALIVSTKYTLGDFYSWLPLNATLEQGEQRRIIEFQSRREFENFGAFPNDLGPQYQFAIQQLLAANDRIEGIWTWTQDGGPWRAGPMTLYGKTGFWQLYELNTLLAVNLARDPDTDVGEVTAGWARQWFSDDPATVEAIVQAMARSRPAIEQGLYIQPFAEQRVFAIGLEPPPMMWIFEWDILTGDSAVLDVLYAISRDATDGDIDAAIAGGEQAVADAERMRELISGTDAATWRDPELRELFAGTMDYEVDSLRMLTAYRAMILHQAQWHDTLSADAYAAWASDRDAFQELAAGHLEHYAGNVDFPAFNLTAAELGVERADRDAAMAWLARVLLVLAAAWVLIGIVAARTRLVRRPGAAAARAAWLGASRPWRARESTLGLLSLDRWLLLIVPGALLVATRAVQTSFLSWTHLAVVLGAWLVFILAVRLCVGRRSPWPVIAAVGGVVVLRCALPLFALSFSGPGGYWFAFWTDPVLRTVYITIAFALFLWVFVAAGWALAAQVGTRRATGFVLSAVGAGLAVPASVVALVGLEASLSAWNDEIGLLPWGLSRILGITVYLDIPDETAWVVAALGVVIATAGVLLAVPWRRTHRVGVGTRA
ncbi:hypothetical protein [Microbacterium pygmaeum]|uniref:Glycosyl hydrolase family 67 C-terminus n=1 Tax=Microbacterium pygmaeum TaxID=370764 RepID=A0A1G8DE12_9MICO|nr:hypothetical protein [Microbacterium pygmaeum]SDH55863.1 hypothetical protein SAMN04489810_3322 [Microbacterium pygmaeum]